MAAGASYACTGHNIAGFLCTVSGTLSVTGTAPDGTTAVTLVNALPVTAGTYHKIPLLLNNPGAVVQLTTAAGTLFI